jgi:Disulphide bond corrector protein DsbC
MLCCSCFWALSGQVTAKGMHASWEASAIKLNDGNAKLTFKVVLDEKWGIYSSKLDANNGPLPVSITIEDAVVLDSLREDGPNVLNYTDMAFKVDVTKFLDEATFEQTVRSSKSNVSAVVRYMLCDDRRCTPPQLVRFDIPMK